MNKIPVRVIGLMFAGVGLILTGFVLIMIFSSSQNDSASVSDLSAVPAKVRYDAPQLTLSDIGGVQHSLSDYHGQVVLVNLWATWCPPCKEEMPNLQAFYVKHQSEGFAIVAVEDGEPAADVIAFVKSQGLTFSIWLDPTYQATDHVFKTNSLPSSYVIDRTGKVRLMWVGAINGQNLETYITPIIKE